MILALTAETEQAKESNPVLRKEHKPIVLNRVYFPETWIWHCFNLKTPREGEFEKTIWS